MTSDSTTIILEELDHPERSAHTRRFSLGRPRSYAVASNGDLVLFLRSRGPLDPVLHLWAADVSGGKERLVVDAAGLLVDGDDLPAEERARRERARESASGIVQYSVSQDGAVAAFTIAGQLYSVVVASGEVTLESAPLGAYDPHVDPTGTRVGFVVHGGLHVLELGGPAREVASDPDPAVTWGVADFIAAEEMGRQRGFWWSPDGRQLLVQRVDNRPVATWTIADPANPDRTPAVHRYPAAGANNATVSLSVFGASGDARVDVTWDADSLPYLASVRWSSAGRCLLAVQSRDQRRLVTLALDADHGSTEVLDEAVGEPWVDVPVGTPRWLPDGRLLTMVDDLDAGVWGTRSLAIDGQRVTPDGLQVQRVSGVDDEGIWFVATTEPTQTHVHVLGLDASAEPRAVTSGPGMHNVVVGSGTRVFVHTSAESYDLEVRVQRGGNEVASIDSHHGVPGVVARPVHLRCGPDELRAVLLLPTDDDGVSALPVIMDPYGGPHAQRVVQSLGAYATSQWLADQGFAVIICDGRGTPSRGPRWEHRIHGDFASGVLEDQIVALHAAAEHEPRLDLGRVGMRGWSFGGYLSALAVLRRPDVFRAGVAGAPVTDWRLYDTHYTERYLGHPEQEPAAYRSSSLIDDHGLVDAAPWPPESRPDLLVIHGLADDNVVAAHALRLSAALLADGRPHRFLPLSGVTHMTPQVRVAANLARLELAFLRETLQG